MADNVTQLSTNAIAAAAAGGALTVENGLVVNGTLTATNHGNVAYGYGSGSSTVAALTAANLTNGPSITIGAGTWKIEAAVVVNASGYANATSVNVVTVNLYDTVAAGNVANGTTAITALSQAGNVSETLSTAVIPSTPYVVSGTATIVLQAFTSVAPANGTIVVPAAGSRIVASRVS